MHLLIFDSTVSISVPCLHHVLYNLYPYIVKRRFLREFSVQLYWSIRFKDLAVRCESGLQYKYCSTVLQYSTDNSGVLYNCTW